jgi:dTDP-4-amino-4,6-dideoxygalactose transaminase
MTARLEERVAEAQQVRHALATTSCTAALHLATLALGLKPGDEVVVPAFTWITSANCAEYVGARAVFADVDPDTYNLDPSALEAAITERTRAVVAVHLFGLAADMDAISDIARRHDLAVIEDAACAIGTTWRGRPVGGLGTIGSFSFHPRKIVTTGEGGMVTTNDDRLADLVRSLRNHGSTGMPDVKKGGKPRPWSMADFDLLGYNLRLSDIQAAVGLGQMEKLPALLAERRASAHRYTEQLRDVNEIVLPVAGDVAGHTYQSYVIRLRHGGRDRRNDVMTSLEEAGIQTRPGTHAVHRLGYYRDKYGLEPDLCPNANLCEDTTITLPIFPGMTAEDTTTVVERLKTALCR